MDKPFVIAPPDITLSKTTIEKLKEERKNVPYVVIKYKSGKTSIWERGDKGRVRCVHGGIKQENEENAIISLAFNCEAQVYYCNKQEAFFLCL